MLVFFRFYQSFKHSNFPSKCYLPSFCHVSVQVLQNRRIMSKRGDTSAALKSAPSENLVSVLKKFYDEYMTSTSKRLKIVDAYLVYILLTGVIQFVYCALVGTFPFNSFLSGFISTVGSFVLAGNCYSFAVNFIVNYTSSNFLCSIYD